MNDQAKNPFAGHEKVLLFGGSFDPPHQAHTLLPQQAAKAIGADLIAYIPAGRAPHKLDRQQTDPYHRLAMLRLAIEAEPGDIPAVVLTDEVKRGPDEPSYTVDTLEQLSKRAGSSTTLRLLIGADQLRIFDQWREPERIIALAEPVVMVRPPDTREALLASLQEDQRDLWAKRLVDVDAMDVSSTEIRNLIEAHQSTEPYVCPAVAGYIADHGLYIES